MRLVAKLSVLLAAASCLALAGALPASAATTHWRVTYRVPSRNDELEGVTAPGSRDAWAFVSRYSQDIFRSAFYLHWNGHVWSRRNVPHPAGFVPYAASSSSPTNVWIIGQTSAGFAVLVYNGSWHANPAPGDLPLTVLASNDAWVMSGPGCSFSGRAWACSTTTYHWNGTTWTPFTVPAYGLNLVGAGRHVWFVGADHVTSPGPPYETGRETLYRWSGRQWRKVAAPDGRIRGYIPAVASAAGKLWLLAKTVRTKEAHLDYWNGHRWSRHDGPPGFGPYPNGGLMSYDGRNGFWIGSYQWTGRRWVNTLPIGSTLYGMYDTVHIPGTASAWAIAEVGSGRFVMAAHGRLP